MGILKTLVDVATIPVAVAADIVTLGGVMTDRDNTYTGDNLRAVASDIVKLYDNLDD